MIGLAAFATIVANPAARPMTAARAALAFLLGALVLTHAGIRRQTWITTRASNIAPMSRAMSWSADGPLGTKFHPENNAGGRPGQQLQQVRPDSVSSVSRDGN